MTAAAAHLTTAPSLTLVRPRRGQTDDGSKGPADGSADTSVLSLAGGRPTGDGPAAPVDARPSTEPDRAPHVRPGTRPLSADDRVLLESMAPALATALVEVLVGARAPVSIEKWVEAPLFDRITEHTRVRRSLSQSNPHTDRPLTTSTARICEVSDSVVEIALVVTTMRRPRALALRLTRRRSRWKLTEFLSI